jgi:hypothetical protein
MPVDIQLGAVTMIMAVWGGFLSAIAIPGKVARAASCAAFAVLGLWGMFSVIIQSRENAKSSHDLDSALKEINRSTTEVSRVQGLNTQLQLRLLSQSQTIAGLANTGIKTVTGADTFCYVALSAAQNGWLMEVVRVGKYPLRAVNIRVSDNNIFQAEMERLHPNIVEKRISPMDAMQQAELQSTKSFGVGDFATDRKFVGGYPYPTGNNEDLAFAISAFNGSWVDHSSQGQW